MKFFAFNLEMLDQTEFFYTGTACGACDKYEICAGPNRVNANHMSDPTTCMKLD